MPESNVSSFKHKNFEVVCFKVMLDLITTFWGNYIHVYVVISTRHKKGTTTNILLQLQKVQNWKIWCACDNRNFRLLLVTKHRFDSLGFVAAETYNLCCFRYIFRTKSTEINFRSNFSIWYFQLKFIFEQCQITKIKLLTVQNKLQNISI